MMTSRMLVMEKRNKVGLMMEQIGGTPALMWKDLEKPSLIKSKIHPETL